MARHGVRLAAFLAQPHPKPPVLREHVLDLHAERRADAGEADRPSIRSAPGRAARHGVVMSILSSSARASSGASTGVLPTFTTCDGPRTDAGRVHRHHLAGHQPVEQMAQRRQPLLDASVRRWSRVCCSIQAATCSGCTSATDAHAVILAPGHELRARRGYRRGGCAGCGWWRRRIPGSAARRGRRRRRSAPALPATLIRRQ